MVRRLVAAGAGLLVVILFFLLLRGCLNARKEQHFKDYVRDVGALVQESDQESQMLFKLLEGNTGSEVDVENQVNAFAGESAKLVDRARQTEHPDEMSPAQRYLVDTLEFRRDGIQGIADALPDAIAQQQERRQGTQRIADQMQKFLASDRIYFDRVRPNIQAALKKEELTENVPSSQFLPSVDWVQPATVARRVGKLGGGGGNDAAAAPGLHGNGIGSVTLGGQTLSEGTSPSTRATPDLKLVVQVANQGENTETDVKVNATIGKGADAIKLTKVLGSIAAGETKSVEMPVADKPPTGQNVPVSVNIDPVPGEKMVDNNKATYSVIFTQ
jgi:hypothetical protein